jgi:hypothetical protein
MKTNSLSLAVALALAFTFVALGQPQAADPAITKTQVYGKVSEINASAGVITLKTPAGSTIAANVNEKTSYERVPPGETDLTKGTASSLTEIAIGDGVIARGFVVADRKSVPAQKIIVVAQSDVAKRNAAERAKWASGVKGIVSSINAATREISVSSLSLMGASQVTIVVVTEKTAMKRYPSDSIPKYSAAKLSRFEEVKIGDQLNARGEKSAEAPRMTAEEVVSGSFKVVGGAITTIDSATKEVTISDLQTKKPLTIILKPESIIRRFPQGASMLRGGLPAGGGQGQPSGGTLPNAAAKEGQGSGGQPPRPGGGPNVADMLQRLPTISLSDLKVGDTIIMSTTQGSDPSRLTAISIIAGVESLLQMIAMRQQAGQARPRSLDLNSNFGGMFGGIGVP